MLLSLPPTRALFRIAVEPKLSWLFLPAGGGGGGAPVQPAEQRPSDLSTESDLAPPQRLAAQKSWQKSAAGWTRYW